MIDHEKEEEGRETKRAEWEKRRGEKWREALDRLKYERGGGKSEGELEKEREEKEEKRKEADPKEK